MAKLSTTEVVSSALLAEHGLRLQSLTVIQSLWAGYGQICLIEAAMDPPPSSSNTSSSAANSNVVTPQERQSLILKLITPPPSRATEEGHTRKILSYQVEQFFYSQLAPQLPPSIPVAKCFTSINQHHDNGTSTTAMVFSNLKEEFPVAGEKRSVLSPIQVHASIDWLANFHGFWWTRVKDLDRRSLVLPPLEEVRKGDQNAHDKSVWLNGGYTYLATRRKEYKDLATDSSSEWSSTLTQPTEQAEGLSISELVAKYLAPNPQSASSYISAYETLIHGDVKSENLFTNLAGDKVAFYDFQYTGLGLGVCDLAKLFTCSIPLEMLVGSEYSIPQHLAMQHGEKLLLRQYWEQLEACGDQRYGWETFVFHWEIALVDWLRFQASWGFWGNTEWLEARVRNILHSVHWRQALVSKMKQ